MHRLMFVIAIAGLATACTSAPSQPEFKASNVVERLGGATETPKWATGAVSMFEEAQDAIYANIVTMDGNSRPEACMKAAEDQGRAAMLRYIKDNITTSGQVNEADAASDPGVESLTAYLAQGKISGVRSAGRYWEKVEESDTSGSRVLRIRCAAKVAIRKSELDRQLKEAISGTKGGNPEIRERLLNAQKAFIDGIDKE